MVARLARPPEVHLDDLPQAFLIFRSNQSSGDQQVGLVWGGSSTPSFLKLGHIRMRMNAAS